MSDSLKPLDYTVHGILQTRILEWVAFPFSRGSSQPQESNPGLPHCRRILYQLSHKGSPRILEWVAYLFSNGSFWPRNQTRVSCIAGVFFTTREAHIPGFPGSLKLYNFYMYIKLKRLTRDFPGGLVVKNLPAMWETWVQSLGWEDPLEKGKTTSIHDYWKNHSLD